MMRIEDYDDADLIVELRSRGFAVYKGEEMQESIAKVEAVKSKLEKIKQMRGKQ